MAADLCSLLVLKELRLITKCLFTADAFCVVVKDVSNLKCAAQRAT